MSQLLSPFVMIRNIESFVPTTPAPKESAPMNKDATPEQMDEWMQEDCRSEYTSCVYRWMLVDFAAFGFVKGRGYLRELPLVLRQFTRATTSCVLCDGKHVWEVLGTSPDPQHPRRLLPRKIGECLTKHVDPQIRCHYD